MTVVSNTTPLNYLLLIGRVEVLSALFERVVIPQAVFRELTSDAAPEESLDGKRAILANHRQNGRHNGP